MSNKTKPPVSLEDIRPLCKKLHLSRMMERLEEQFADPSIQELPPLEIIHDSLTSEVDRREENALKRRLREAHIRHQDACLGNIDLTLRAVWTRRRLWLWAIATRSATIRIASSPVRPVVEKHSSPEQLLTPLADKALPYVSFGCLAS